ATLATILLSPTLLAASGRRNTLHTRYGRRRSSGGTDSESFGYNPSTIVVYSSQVIRLTHASRLSPRSPFEVYRFFRKTERAFTISLTYTPPQGADGDSCLIWSGAVHIDFGVPRRQPVILPRNGSR